MVGCAVASPQDRRREAPPIESDRVWTDPVDFLELRTEYGNRGDFGAICESNRPLRELYEAADAANWYTVLELSARWLDSCPVDIDAHFLRAVALQEVGEVAESDAHARWFDGLVRSVLDSGDGKSSDSAFVVISVNEEYAILRALGLEHESQSLLGGGVDAISVVDADGNRSTVYFRPVAHFRRLEEMLRGVE